MINSPEKQPEPAGLQPSRPDVWWCRLLGERPYNADGRAAFLALVPERYLRDSLAATSPKPTIWIPSND